MKLFVTSSLAQYIQEYNTTLIIRLSKLDIRRWS